MVSGVCVKYKVSVLNRVVKVRLTKKVRFKQRLEAREGTNLVVFWRKTFPGREYGQSKAWGMPGGFKEKQEVQRGFSRVSKGRSSRGQKREGQRRKYADPYLQE